MFHSGEGYVVRWEYRIVKVRALRNVKNIEDAGGRDMCCYFFWLGNDCSVTEQGATAVMTIELDKEKGPQVKYFSLHKLTKINQFICASSYRLTL